MVCSLFSAVFLLGLFDGVSGSNNRGAQMKYNTQDADLCQRYSWLIESLSPFEIRHADGSFATGQAAEIVLRHLQEQDAEIVKGLKRCPSCFTVYSPEALLCSRECHIKLVPLRGE